MVSVLLRFKFTLTFIWYLWGWFSRFSLWLLSLFWHHGLGDLGLRKFMGSHKVHSLQDLLSWTSPDVHPGYISGVSCVGMVMLAQEKIIYCTTSNNWCPSYWKIYFVLLMKDRPGFLIHSWELVVLFLPLLIYPLSVWFFWPIPLPFILKIVRY